jgi:hypothetical protein
MLNCSGKLPVTPPLSNDLRKGHPIIMFGMNQTSSAKHVPAFSISHCGFSINHLSHSGSWSDQGQHHTHGRLSGRLFAMFSIVMQSSSEWHESCRHSQFRHTPRTVAVDASPIDTHRAACRPSRQGPAVKIPAPSLARDQAQQQLLFCVCVPIYCAL